MSQAAKTYYFKYKAKHGPVASVENAPRGKKLQAQIAFREQQLARKAASKKSIQQTAVNRGVKAQAVTPSKTETTSANNALKLQYMAIIENANKVIKKTKRASAANRFIDRRYEAEQALKYIEENPLKDVTPQESRLISKLTIEDLKDPKGIANLLKKRAAKKHIEDKRKREAREERVDKETSSRQGSSHLLQGKEISNVRSDYQGDGKDKGIVGKVYGNAEERQRRYDTSSIVKSGGSVQRMGSSGVRRQVFYDMLEYADKNDPKAFEMLLEIADEDPKGAYKLAREMRNHLNTPRKGRKEDRSKIAKANLDKFTKGRRESILTDKDKEPFTEEGKKKAMDHLEKISKTEPKQEKTGAKWDSIQRRNFANVKANKGKEKKDITVDSVIAMNKKVLTDSQPHAVINKGAIERTLASAEYYDKKEDKAAAIVKGIIGGHPFQDGNHRVAIMIASSILGRPLKLSAEQAYQIDNKTDINDIKKWL